MLPLRAAHAADAALAAALADAARSPAFVARDAVRHPQQELEFFGLRPDQTVVEVSPGAGYWTEFLAPYLHEHGTFYVAVPPRKDAEAAARDPLRAKLAADPARYGKVRITQLGQDHYQVAPDGSADLILTFRNLHNWMKAGYAAQALKGFFEALKPGGILGIEDHRGRNDVPQDPAADSGYVRQDYTIQLAQQAGFEFVDSSEINANPRDSKDWPKGVWTLPPTLALKDQDRDRYLAVGEADNYVLRFRKPMH
ncbi:MAG: class I SAM-dependent methyltransferase [Pseudomonadota bacterium]|nr:class I SAM-dependent methyltransferase [Pseudomonadota bacterium]